MTDLELWEYAKRFVRRYRSTLMCGRDDLAVEVWIALHRKMPGFNPALMAQEAFMSTVATQAVWKAWRNTSGIPCTAWERGVRLSQMPYEDWDRPVKSRADDVVIAWDMLRGLTPKEKRIVSLRMAGYQSCEIGPMVGYTKSTVDSHVQDLKAKVRANLEEERRCIEQAGL